MSKAWRGGFDTERRYDTGSAPPRAWILLEKCGMISAMIRIAIIVAIIAVGVSFEADAAGFCRPSLDGKDRIENNGACPSGYFARGACCEAFQASGQRAAPKVDGKACPAGTVASLAGCVAAK